MTQGRARKTAAVGAAAFVLAGSAALAVPAPAEAAVLTGSCGSTITGSPGDKIKVDPSSLLGLPKGTLPALDLGFISLGTKTLSQAVPLVGSLLTKLCSVTVTGVNAAAAPAESGASAVNKAVGDTAKAVGEAAGKAFNPGKKPAPEKPPADGRPPQTPPDGATGPIGGSAPDSFIPAPNSEVYGGTPFTFAGLPGSFGYAPMRSYNGLPFATAGLFSPAPGVRYGGQVPGYAPEFGILGQDARKAPANGVQNAGNAEALPANSGGLGDSTGLPLLLAVLALSGVSAGLVRTWVLRRITD
ncbi:hypothetical protein [Amycolatopsis nigrescens]|uniref:hypothetical protein n=1 Tax=Amycolatopsis nigrescens TaxID=381445 RepID=UPI000399B37C|nr:hypothetical protein [Amycolatopsis nigrescens]